MTDTQTTRRPRARTTTRRVANPNFGRQLERLRELAKQSRGQVCRGLKRFGLDVDRSTLLQYEHGTVGAPDPAILWALGRHYGLDTIDELLAVLVMDRTGRQLRVGVEISTSPYTVKQREIAEAYGSFPREIQIAIETVFAGLRAGDLSAAHLGTAKKAHRA